MSSVLNYQPGAQVTIILQILNNLGFREDGYTTPMVSSLFLPDLSQSGLYPLPMIRIERGLYYHKFTLPTGASAVGTYIADLAYTDGYNNYLQDFVQIVCSANFGQFSVSPT